VENVGFAHKEIIPEDNDVYLEKTVYIYEYVVNYRMINILLSNTQLVDATQDKYLWLYVTVRTRHRKRNCKFKMRK